MKARDLYAEYNINPGDGKPSTGKVSSAPRDLYAEYGINPSSLPSQDESNIPSSHQGMQDYVHKNLQGMQQAAGYVAPFLAPEVKAPGMIQSALAKLPFSKATQGTANYLTRAGLGTGITTAATQNSPDNNSSLQENLGQNALMNAGAELLPPLVGSAVNLGKKAVNAISPGFHAKQIVQDLGQGAKTAEQNSQSLSKDLYNAHNEHMQNFKNIADPVFNQYGKEEIYPFENPSGIHATRNMPKLNLSAISGEAKPFYKAFKKEPTLENAHNLQSQIGVELGSAMRQPPSADKNRIVNELKSSRDTLKVGMDSFLRKKDPAAADQLIKASNYFKNNIVPYRSDTLLQSIVKGKETNPENIHNLFKYPSDEVDPSTQKNIIGPIKKVINDLPESSKGKILFSKAGLHNAVSPTQLANKLETARNSGYSEYFTPKLENKLNELGGKIGIGKAVQHVGAGAAGLLTGRLLPFPGASEALGVGGLLANPSTYSSVNSLLPNKMPGKSVNKLIKKAYTPLAREGIINTLNNQ